MTNPHAKAVEAAAGRLASDYYAHVGRRLTRAVATRFMERAIDAMRAEGWVMVRDCGDAEAEHAPAWNHIEGSHYAWAGGWNACRAIMLGGAGDGQG